MINSKKGFTLIELLVVVLIISILAAIALPQYQVAVTKSRLGAVLPMLRTIKDAQEMYYLNNAVYTDDLNKLELSYNYNLNITPSSITSGFISFPNGVYIDNLSSGPSYPEQADVVVAVGKRDNYIVMYRVLLDHSARPGLVTCTGYNDIGNKVCKAMGF